MTYVACEAYGGAGHPDNIDEAEAQQRDRDVTAEDVEEPKRSLAVDNTSLRRQLQRHRDEAQRMEAELEPREARRNAVGPHMGAVDAGQYHNIARVTRKGRPQQRRRRTTAG
jgi:hypothetical protein